MRDLISIVERVVYGEIPDVVYHGTSSVAWDEIRSSNQIVGMAINGTSTDVCFTTSKHVATWFAKESCDREQSCRPVIIVVDARKLARDYVLTPYIDKDKSGDLDSEEEIRAHTNVIDNFNDYVLEVILI